MKNLTIDQKSVLYKQAFILVYITVFYNIIEGLVSIFFGIKDETLSLFGFGIDSIIEVISGIGIWHMLLKMGSQEDRKDEFEKTALKITGAAFYILTAGLIITIVYNISTNQKPETTFWGIVISLISIFSMSLLIIFKLKVGNALNSQALITDATCTKTCLYLSIILLVSSIGYEITGLAGVDSFGALLIAYFSFKEGRESFKKAKSDSYCSCDDD